MSDIVFTDFILKEGLLRIYFLKCLYISTAAIVLSLKKEKHIKFSKMVLFQMEDSSDAVLRCAIVIEFFRINVTRKKKSC